MTCCIRHTRAAARMADGMAVVDDARVIESDVGRAVEVTLRGRERVPHGLSDAMVGHGLRLDLRRSGTRTGAATVVYR